MISIKNKESLNDGFAKIAIIVSIIFVLAIGAVAAYFLVFKNPGNTPNNTATLPKEPSPDEIFDSSFKAMGNIKTYNLNTDASLDIKTEIDQDAMDRIFMITKPEKENNIMLGMPEEPKMSEIRGNIGLKVKSEIDISDVRNPKESSKIYLEAGMASEGGSIKASLDAEEKNINNKLVYFKLNSYDLGAIGFMYGSYLSPYKGKWYKWDMNEYQKELEESSGMSISSDEINSAYDNLYSEMEQKIKKIFDEHDYLDVKKNLGDAKIGETDVYHYQIMINKDEVVDSYLELITEISDEYRKNMNSARDLNSIAREIEFTNKMKEEIKKYGYVIDIVLENLNTEVWIGKEDKFMHKILVTAKIDDELFKRIQEAMISKEILKRKMKNLISAILK